MSQKLARLANNFPPVPALRATSAVYRRRRAAGGDQFGSDSMDTPDPNWVIRSMEIYAGPLCRECGDEIPAGGPFCEECELDKELPHE